ncbi:MAG: hypothetical protein CMI18_09665 [Opitutaceae bacterium]|nr:hypothetical protein [Opitutaceae bacterium]
MANLDFINNFGVLTWEDGESADKTIIIDLINDALLEGDGTFTIQLLETSGSSVPDQNNFQSITVQDNKGESQSWFEFSTVLYSGTESPESLNVSVERFGDGVGRASVRI